jgi:hydrogenase expression/formation protein HypE
METLTAVVNSMAHTAREAGSPSSPAIPKWSSAVRPISCLSTPPEWGHPADIHWGAQQLSAGDVLLVSGTLGCHGATILNLREGWGWTANCAATARCSPR